MSVSPGNSVEVLLVEDDIGDIELTREAMVDSKLAVNLHVVKDGVEALKYLRQQGEHQRAIAPDLILLDLNLPRKDGREVLEDIKNDPALKRIPVIVLTTSDTEEDIVRSYNLGVNCYVQKPVGMEEFIRIVKVLEDFWFTIVKLPPH
ncbi:MAG: response regulator [Cyanobacteria bacterium P01_A01_bin.116]